VLLATAVSCSAKMGFVEVGHKFLFPDV
jgi:hypothetical protein